jgi:hypothetical protein
VRANSRSITDDVEAGNARRALIGQEERHENANGSGLAGAVRTEEPEDHSGLDAQVDAAQRSYVAVALPQPLSLDGRLRGRHASTLPIRLRSAGFGDGLRHGAVA